MRFYVKNFNKYNKKVSQICPEGICHKYSQKPIIGIYISSFLSASLFIDVLFEIFTCQVLFEMRFFFLVTFYYFDNMIEYKFERVCCMSREILLTTSTL